MDWDLARRVAVRVSGAGTGRAGPRPAASLDGDFAEYTPMAERLASEETGLQLPRRPGPGRVTDRAAGSTPTSGRSSACCGRSPDKLGEAAGSGHGMRGLTRKVAAVELGGCSAGCSRRVLGQYDLLVIEDENPEDQDLVYYVGPNVLGLEKRFGFPPREFRLWLALHEVTHRAQFTGVPWLRAHFLGLVERDPGLRRPRPQAPPRGHRPGRAERPRRAATRSTTAASSRCSPRPSSAPCSTGSAG